MRMNYAEGVRETRLNREGRIVEIVDESEDSESSIGLRRN